MEDVERVYADAVRHYKSERRWFIGSALVFSICLLHLDVFSTVAWGLYCAWTGWGMWQAGKTLDKIIKVKQAWDRQYR